MQKIWGAAWDVVGTVCCLYCSIHTPSILHDSRKVTWVPHCVIEDITNKSNVKLVNTISKLTKSVPECKYTCWLLTRPPPGAEGAATWTYSNAYWRCFIHTPTLVVFSPATCSQSLTFTSLIKTPQQYCCVAASYRDTVPRCIVKSKIPPMFDFGPYHWCDLNVSIHLVSWFQSHTVFLPWRACTKILIWPTMIDTENNISEISESLHWFLRSAAWW